MREHRHRTTLERHLKKYEHLWQKNRAGCSNIGDCSNQTCIKQDSDITLDTLSDTVPDTVSSSPSTISVPAIVPTLLEATTAVATTTTIVQSKWVKNLSKAPLTEAQMSLLAHGPNFAITPRSPSYGEYITVVEQVCLNLEPQNAEELMAEIRGALRHAHNPRKNITKEEAQTLADLRKDH